MTIEFFPLFWGAMASLANLLLLGATFYPLIVKHKHGVYAIVGCVLSLSWLGGCGYFGAQLEGSGAIFFALGFAAAVFIVAMFYPLLSRIIGPVDQPAKSFHESRTA